MHTSHPRRASAASSASAPVGVPPHAAAALVLLGCAAPVAADWRTDPAWYDGKAEVCVYDATLEIYGTVRTYRATIYTNKQTMDPRLGVKTSGEGGIEVFKQHRSERIPTENYDYDYSIAVFARTDDLSLFKLTRASQEDCGATFTHVLRGDGALGYWTSGYFPGEGVREGTLDDDLVFEDALPLLLRDFPFASPRERRVRMIPSMRTNRLPSLEPVPRLLRYGGAETLDLPAGRIAAHRIEVVTPAGEVESRLWFAAADEAPWLHAMVAYEGSRGASYRLVSIERRAYWKR